MGVVPGWVRPKASTTMGALLKGGCPSVKSPMVATTPTLSGTNSGADASTGVG